MFFLCFEHSVCVQLNLAELLLAGRDGQGNRHHHHVQVRGTHQHRRSPDRVLRRRVQGDDPAMAGRQEKSLAG